MSLSPDSSTTAGRGANLTTPTGAQGHATLGRRRRLVIALNAATYLILMAAASLVIDGLGWTGAGISMLACFAVGLPWAVLGFWNAVIGLLLLHGTRQPLDHVAPFARAGDVPSPILIRTAILMTLRNEDPDRAFRRLGAVKASLDATGFGHAFSYFALSDTSDGTVAAAEEAAVEAWRQDVGPDDARRIVYRRRAHNTGYKAGNLRDFCERWGADFELMLPLDADSLMSGETILRMTRMMQAHSELGILQSLVVGLPSSSAFARIFQFGMRHGMRTYTMGQAWWTGDCGPFWGHNALVRIRPFAEACQLPILPGKPPLGGHVLSHDQVEATLMRRAGFEVRVLPEEAGSWEENPPTLLDFMKRDVRWCQGNMQYVKLLDLPGLKPMSRFQLAWAIAMFVGLPAWTLMIALTPVIAWQAKSAPAFPAGLAAVVYVTYLVMYLAPKIAGLIDVGLRTGGARAYGGPLRFAASAAIELVFSFLQGAATALRTSVFMVGLAFGHSVQWGGQSRDAYGIGWGTALRNLWPQTLFGIGVCGALYLIEPVVLLWSLPLTIGYLVAIPFAVVSASPAVGRAFRALGLCAIPEDFSPPAELAALSGKACPPPVAARAKDVDAVPA